eukprot:Lankesteria_metandrocarpae@DN9784_c0_g1_i1.p1
MRSVGFVLNSMSVLTLGASWHAVHCCDNSNEKDNWFTESDTYPQGHDVANLFPPQNEGFTPEFEKFFSEFCKPAIDNEASFPEIESGSSLVQPDLPLTQPMAENLGGANGSNSAPVFNYRSQVEERFKLLNPISDWRQKAERRKTDRRLERYQKTRKEVHYLLRLQKTHPELLTPDGKKKLESYADDKRKHSIRSASARARKKEEARSFEVRNSLN